MKESDLIADFIINNPNGLHARPGAFLVNVLKPFKSEVKITNTNRDTKIVNARSLLNLMVLGIKKGHNIRVFIRGDDAQETLATLQDAISSGLGES
ncbi:HPr family phosphocarrier protein [Yersinia intermedia]|uniref:HPr family phosphocarrier protein n=1 Tax=Yersinia intermedia TaxID=631 RepID=UPI0022FEBBF6|nr:HPr family phosphocarrier protein [Yersinia intermedia]MDA5483315.1 HPr family phosphocarrier protein [Yersinia intermedia]